MFKKYFYFAIATVMILSLGACKPQTNVNSPDVTDIIQYYDAEGNLVAGDNQISVTQKPGTSSAAFIPDKPGAVDPNYKIDKVYNTDVTFHVGWTNTDVDLGKDQLGQYIQNKFRCKFDLKILPDEKILLLAAQDKLPDFFKLQLGATIYSQLDRPDQKFLYHIPRTAIDQYPLLKHYFNLDDYLNAFSDTSYDKQYVGLPFLISPVKSGLGYDTSIFYRKDWAKNVGYDVTIDTMDKAYNLMKLFRENDPDGNGFRDTYGFSGFMWDIEWLPWVDPISWVRETDSNSEFYNMYIPGYVNSRLFEAIKYWNRMLKEQIMPADFNLQKPMDAFNADQAGVSYGNSGYYWRWEFLVNRFDPAHKDLYPKLPKINGKTQTAQDVVGEFEVLKLNENSPPRHPAVFQNQMTAISAKAGTDADKMSRIFDFYEWSITHEAADLYTYGILGKDYKLDSNGMAVQTLPDSTTTPGAMKKLWEVYPSLLISQLVSWGASDPTPSRTYAYPEWIIKWTDQVQINKDKYVVPSTTVINNIMTPAKERHLDAYNLTWWQDKINRIIAEDGGKTIEQGWNDFKTEFFDIKEGRQAVKEVNDVMKAKSYIGQP